MYGIIARNSGMWGFSSWCKKDGEIELYASKEEAQKVVDEINNNRSPINNFTSYYVSKYEED